MTVLAAALQYEKSEILLHCLIDLWTQQASENPSPWSTATFVQVSCGTNLAHLEFISLNVATVVCIIISPGLWVGGGREGVTQQTLCHSLGLKCITQMM